MGEPHIRDDRASLSFDRPAEEVDTIDAIERTERVFEPDYAPDG